MIRFILNEKEITTTLAPGMLLLDFIRYHQHLLGTKIGCREGDCGACTVLVGEIKENKLSYSSATSCLMPLGNAHGKHIVTIEGINMKQLNPVQQAMSDNSATQCGFCTPGFVMSLAGFCLSDKAPTKENAIACIDGNICRCTGYKSIERAAAQVATSLEGRKEDIISFVTGKNIVPEYFNSIEKKLLSFKTNNAAAGNSTKQFVGGGTDLYVQKHDEMKDAEIDFLYGRSDLKGIRKDGDKCIIGASSTVTDLLHDPVMLEYFPGLQDYIKLVSSTPIRNMATVAGNFVNASPIGDLTIFFLALDAKIILRTSSDRGKGREIALRKFYKGYKQLDKKPDEYIEQVWFELPSASTKFHFEKLSKRTNLDIASVNSAISITVDENKIINASISAGGVGPTPMYLEKTSAFLSGKSISEGVIKELAQLAQSEISPISDARGQADYKRLLLSQLIKAHFISLFPELNAEILLQ